MKPPGSAVRQIVHFVGREEAIKEVRESLEHIGYLYVDEAKGIEGIGKTLLLVKLFQDIAQQGDFHPIWVELPDLSQTRVDDSVGTLVDNIYFYWQLLKNLAARLPASAFEDFATTADGIYRNTVSGLLQRQIKADVNLGGVSIETGSIDIHMLSRVAKEAVIKTGDVAIELKVPDDDIRLAVRGLLDAITREFAKRMNGLGDKIRAVVFFDNFHTIMDRDLGRWLISELALQLDNCVFVDSRIQSSKQIPCSKDIVVELPMADLSRKQVKEYLTSRLKLSPLPAGLAKQVFNFSGGHPQAMALAADLIDSELEKKNPISDILRRLDDIPSERPEKIRKLVNDIIKNIEDEDIRTALEIGWVVRRFDADILGCLIRGKVEEDEEDAPSADYYQDIIERLSEYSFTESHPPDKSVPVYYKFHDFIRQVMEKEYSAKRVEELHGLAAAYYTSRLLDYEEEAKDQSAYLRWYRYEDPDWQVMRTEWLYHVARMSDRQNARLHFARIFFEAFWWWGWYHPFPFCEQLLTLWGGTQLSDKDQELLRQITKFHNTYPTGYDKQGKASWPKAQQALNSLRMMLGLDAAIQNDNDKYRRHLKAITSDFLGDAYRYHDLNDPRADRYYLEARELFADLDDEWNMSWAIYDLSDLYMNRGQGQKALEEVKQAVNILFDEDPTDRDYELIANLRRMQADVFWQSGETDRALRNYARAVFCAYAFHAFPYIDDQPTPPDFYTLALHREMVERTLARIKNLWGAGEKEAAVLACSQLRDFFGPYWDLVGRSPDPPPFSDLFSDDRVHELTRFIFPREPEEDELGKSSQYMDDISYLVLGAMSGQIETDT